MLLAECNIEILSTSLRVLFYVQICMDNIINEQIKI